MHDNDHNHNRNRNGTVAASILHPRKCPLLFLCEPLAAANKPRLSLCLLVALFGLVRDFPARTQSAPLIAITITTIHPLLCPHHRLWLCLLLV
jgi:hypothetical protein